MSLISLRNFASPFRSKAQIAAIIITGLLVAVLRMAGGGASIGSDARRDLMDASSLTEFRSRRAQDGSDYPEKGPGKRREQATDDMLHALVDGSFERERQKQREAERKNSEFDDIRRSLGME